MKTLLITTSIVLTILGIGVAQNYFNNPERGCKQFNTGTVYKGYQCKNGAVYTR